MNLPLAMSKHAANSDSAAPLGSYRARQQRSAVTEGKLLEAAMHVLATESYEAITVPRIAAAAGVSPAALYRRFADKDDLLRSALLHSLAAAHAAHAVHWPTRCARPTLAESCEQLAGALLKKQRAYPLLLPALQRVLASSSDKPFAKQVREQLEADLAVAAGVLLAHRDSIRHPDPERAVRFAVLSATSCLEAFVRTQDPVWTFALPLSEKAMVVELSRQMLGYLRRKS